MTIGLENVGLAFGLVIMAGLSTGLGAAAVYFRALVKLASKPVLASGLGFSGGVMIYVSFVEIFGMLLLRFLAYIVHCLDKDHHCACEDGGDCPPEGAADCCVAEDIKLDVQPTPVSEEKPNDGSASPQDTSNAPSKSALQKDKKLQQMGLNTAMAIGIHNFPEGLATFVATLADPTVGLTLAVAIAIHNIPEGLCVALPIYYATGSRHKGFVWALLSGISEPIGALIGYGIIKSTGDDMNQIVYGVLFGVVAGMMVMIVLLELLPTAYRYDPTDRCVTNSLVLGMLVMAASLCLFLA